jgi:hypothetical protein
MVADEVVVVEALATLLCLSNASDVASDVASQRWR